ncbi:MaoC/PaaZ C-terminal domain-containing protein, partial [Methylobacterium hispanicum]
MSAPFYEDFEPGDRIVSTPLTVGRDEIVAFAREFDPQPFHLDEAAAEATFVGKLIASGWQTAALGMRLLHASVFRGATTLGSPGIDELRWMLPVVPGDSLVLKTTVEDCRASTSKPGVGFVRFAARLENGAGRIVMTQGFSVMFQRRGAEPPPPRPVTLAAPEPPPEPNDAEILDFIGQAEIGRTRDLGPYTFTAEDIVAFARAYDPQAFHLDPEAAARTHFGGLCASGWHTAAAYMRRLTTTRARD